jgi:hypothetical protein
MIGLVVSMVLFNKTKLILAREENTVKGVSYKDVTADYGVWTINLSVTKPTKLSSLEEMKKQQQIIEQHLLEFKSFTVEKGIPTTLENYEYNDQNKKLVGYESTISFKITSYDVSQLYSEAVAFNTFAVEKDLSINTNSTSFYYSKLDTLKINLLEQAVADAKNRAQALSSSSDTKIGKVKSASQGIFQVNERNSFDVSAGGNFNTESVDKTVQATVDITFELL